MEPSQDLDAWADEPPLLEPSDDEGIPAEPVAKPLYLRLHFNLPLNSPDPRLAVQTDISLSQPSAPKRPGEPLDASSSREERSSQDPVVADLEAHSSDFGIPM